MQCTTPQSTSAADSERRQGGGEASVTMKAVAEDSSIRAVLGRAEVSLLLLILSCLGTTASDLFQITRARQTSRV